MRSRHGRDNRDETRTDALLIRPLKRSQSSNAASSSRYAMNTAIVRDRK